MRTPYLSYHQSVGILIATIIIIIIIIRRRIKAIKIIINNKYKMMRLI